MFNELYDALINKRTTPALILDSMALGTKNVEEKRVFELMARMYRDLNREKYEYKEEINKAWEAIGFYNQNHLSLPEAISARLRDEGKNA